MDLAIEARQPARYDEAITLLSDLRAVSEREDRRDAFDQRLRDLHQRHTRKVSLLQRLERAKLSQRRTDRTLEPHADGAQAGRR